jgi:hypothetical protein
MSQIYQRLARKLHAEHGVGVSEIVAVPGDTSAWCTVGLEKKLVSSCPVRDALRFPTRLVDEQHHFRVSIDFDRITPPSGKKWVRIPPVGLDMQIENAMAGKKPAIEDKVSALNEGRIIAVNGRFVCSETATIDDGDIVYRFAKKGAKYHYPVAYADVICEFEATP